MDIVGKKILVTGGAKRIGRSIVQAFCDRGAKVFIHYQSSVKDALALAKELDLPKNHLYRADLTKKSQIDRMAAAIRLDHGGVDILVNNASIFYPTEFSKISEKDWEDHLAVHVTAPFYLSQALAPGMEKRGGRIINIADWVIQKPYKNFLPYTVSKAGLLALTEGLAKILAPQVLVTAVCPGPILPPPDYSSTMKKKVAAKTLLGRWGRPEDIAKTVVFLAESDFITGSFHVVDGGDRLSR